MYKAAEYFKIQLIRVGVDKEGRMKVDEVKKKINKNIETEIFRYINLQRSLYLLKYRKFLTIPQ